MDLSFFLQLSGSVQEELIAYLAQFITPRRLERMRKVLQWRTFYITLVLEDVYQPHNASAIIRTCDLLGIQRIHVVERRNRFSPSRGVSLGAENWVQVIRHPNSSVIQVAHQLKAKGYSVVATLPDAPCSLLDYSIQSPIALVFGTEKEGLSEEAISVADHHISIPMYGFTQSYNVSVSVGLCLFHLVHQLHQSDLPWKLDEKEKRYILFKWLYKDSVKAEVLVSQFLKERGY